MSTRQQNERKFGHWDATPDGGRRYDLEVAGMTITKQTVANRLTAYLHHEITLSQLVDWAENALLKGAFAPRDTQVLSSVIARMGLADVRAFGLTWDDCELFLSQLGYVARVDVTTAGSHQLLSVREKPDRKYGR